MNRSDRWIYFPSVTYANKAKQLLSRENIITRMERTPMSYRGAGCGYRLAVTAQNYDNAVNICKDAGIPMRDPEHKREGAG